MYFTLKTSIHSSALGGSVIGCATNWVRTLCSFLASYPSKSSWIQLHSLFYLSVPIKAGKIHSGYETSITHNIFTRRCFIQERCSTGPTYLICYVSRSVHTHWSMNNSASQTRVRTFDLMTSVQLQGGDCVINFRSWGIPSLTAVWGSTKKKDGRWRTCWVSNSNSGACTFSTHLWLKEILKSLVFKI